MSYSLFDTHAHYDHPLFGGKGPEIVKSLFEEHIVNGIVIPAISFESNYSREVFPEEEFPKVFFAAGLHPKRATNESWWDAKKREEFEKIVLDRRTVAIKTGLDFYKQRLSEAQKRHQERFFRYFIEVSNRVQKPLVLHVRAAAEEAIAVLKEVTPAQEIDVHCFAYDKDVANKMLETGVTRFGIGGMLTWDGMESLREFVRELPLSRILMETDAPFVKPIGFEKELNTSQSLIGIVRLIAELKGLDLQEVVLAVQRNAKEFYAV